jgi:hypothetical protein
VELGVGIYRSRGTDEENWFGQNELREEENKAQKRETGKMLQKFEEAKSKKKKRRNDTAMSTNTTKRHHKNTQRKIIPPSAPFYPSINPPSIHPPTLNPSSERTVPDRDNHKPTANITSQRKKRPWVWLGKEKRWGRSKADHGGIQ